MHRPTLAASPSPSKSLRLASHGGGKLDLPAHPLLDCSFALTFAGFLRDLVAPLGEAMLGATVVMLDTGPGYYCRDVDRVSGAVNPHGKGIAIDVSAVLLADRRRIAVGTRQIPKRLCSCKRCGAGLRMVHDHIGAGRPRSRRPFPLRHPTPRCDRQLSALRIAGCRCDLFGLFIAGGGKSERFARTRAGWRRPSTRWTAFDPRGPIRVPRRCCRDIDSLAPDRVARGDDGRPACKRDFR